MKIHDSGMPDMQYWESLFDVELILNRLDINHQIASLAEFGCGYGTFTLPAAQRITGNVYALDIDAEVIETAKSRADGDNITNIKFLLRDLIVEGTGLDDNSVDFVMLFNILHHFDPSILLNEAYRILKAGGKAGLIHWNYDPSTPRGPSLDIRPKPHDMKRWALDTGFQLMVENVVDLPPYHYGYLLYK